MIVIIVPPGTNTNMCWHNYQIHLQALNANKCWHITQIWFLSAPQQPAQVVFKQLWLATWVWILRSEKNWFGLCPPSTFSQKLHIYTSYLSMLIQTYHPPLWSYWGKSEKCLHIKHSPISIRMKSDVMITMWEKLSSDLNCEKN